MGMTRQYVAGELSVLLGNLQAVTTTEAPRVGKGMVGAVMSQVGRIGGRNVVICRSEGSMRRGAITNADGVRLATDLYLPALLDGMFGSKRWMAMRLGEHGGRARSTAKAAASRRNGKLGGRPRRKVSA